MDESGLGISALYADSEIRRTLTLTMNASRFTMASWPLVVGYLKAALFAATQSLSSTVLPMSFLTFSTERRSSNPCIRIKSEIGRNSLALLIR